MSNSILCDVIWCTKLSSVCLFFMWVKIKYSGGVTVYGQSETISAESYNLVSNLVSYSASAPRSLTTFLYTGIVLITTVSCVGKIEALTPKQIALEAFSKLFDLPSVSPTATKFPRNFHLYVYVKKYSIFPFPNWTVLCGKGFNKGLGMSIKLSLKRFTWTFILKRS